MLMNLKHLRGRIVFVRIAGLSLLALVFSTRFLLAQETAVTRPNILFCLADCHAGPNTGLHTQR